MSDQAPAPVAAVQSTPAPVEQSIDARIGNIAKGFLEDLDRNDDPDQITEESPPQEEAAPVDEAPQEPTEAEQATPEVPMVEVDVDGEKFLVPEKVKHRVMADKDYRQKTMEVAAERKQVEQIQATATQLAQQAQQLAPYYAQLHSMDSRAQFLQQSLQRPELAADPVEYNRVQGELAILLHQRGQFAQGLHQVQAQFSEQERQLRIQKLSVDAPKLFEQFPDLKKPEIQQKLAKYIRDEGLSEEEVAHLNFSAAGTKLAWKAHQYDLMVAEQAKSRQKLAEKTKTLPAATQSSRADTGAKDQQARREWQKRGAKWNDPLFQPLRRTK